MHNGGPQSITALKLNKIAFNDIKMRIYGCRAQIIKYSIAVRCAVLREQPSQMSGVRFLQTFILICIQAKIN